MSQIKKSLTNVLAATIGVTVLAVVAAWQFYLFATFKDSQGGFDAQGGTGHLWLAIGAALVACVAGFFLFSFFVRYDKSNEMHITS